MTLSKWVQELMWVKRNEQGVVIGTSEKLPENVDFIPTVSSKPKKGEIGNDQ